MWLALPRRYLVFPIDLAFMVISYVLAHWIRYESLIFLDLVKNFYVSLFIVVVTRGVVFAFSGIYRSLWAYASLHDLVEIIKTTILSSLVSTTALLFYNRFYQHSRMVPVLDTLLLLSFLCLRSFSWRIFRDEFLKPKTSPNGTRTLLLGAGKVGAYFLSESKRQSEVRFTILGFLDDDSSKIGGHIQGIPILGNLDTLSKWIDTFAVEQVIFTMSNPDGKIISKVRTVCDEHKVTFKILPALSELLDLNFNIKSLREVQVEDLLGRPVVDLDLVSIQSYLRGKKILITGSGGSIGSELARQVLHFKPSTIILLDSAETPLYEIDYELRNHYGELDVNFLPVICDIKNLSRLSQVFEQHSPDVVFHSAAYKHVPMMEIQPQEAVLNNVMGTKNLVDVSRLSGVERFVLISTDKAVNPVNIMGATKRAAELYIQFVSANSKTKFITVRFGNVLGSNGSVIPRFKEQIKKGGPVTVTHPDVIRFFMTIQEASQLVLQAGSMGEHGEIFILEMGEPVKILSLAEEMIRLSGFTPYKDINIEFSGLRPGEKLFEELLLDKEGTIATHHPKIRIATNLEEPNPLILQNKLNNLFTAAKANKAEEIFFLLKDLIPEYQIHKEYVSQNKISIRPNG